MAERSLTRRFQYQREYLDWIQESQGKVEVLSVAYTALDVVVTYRRVLPARLALVPQPT